MAIPIRIPIALLFLFGLLYLSLQQALRGTPPMNFSVDNTVDAGQLSRFNLRELEIFLKGILEKTRSGESISHESEVNLRNMKALLAMYTSANQKLVAKLIALINQILELNGELIHQEDGEHQSDHS